MKTTPQKHYEDFVISSPSKLFYLLKPFVWLANFINKKSRPRYYGTTVRRVGKSKVEVTFELPPAVKQRMHNAIEAGKQIRLFVL